MGNQQSTPYDAVIKINLLSSLQENKNNKGVPIIFDEKNRTKAIKLLKEGSWGASTFVGLLGSYNAGKTFFLNKYSGYACPSGVTISTEGLSFKHVKNNGDVIVIDTAGLNTPVKMNDKQLEPLADRKSADQFLQSIVFKMSDIFIVVVNFLSFKEQENIIQLVSRLRNTPNRNNFLIIIHNWKDCAKQEDMDKLYKTQICELYLDGKEATTNVEKVTVKWFNNNLTRHVFMGKEPHFTSHNNNVMKLILMWIDAYKPPTTRSYSLIQSLQETAKYVLEDFVQDLSDVNVDLDKGLFSAKFTNIKPFTFSSSTGILLSNPVKSLQFNTKNGLKYVLEIPGTKIKPSIFPNCIKVVYSPMDTITAIFQEYNSVINDEAKLNNGIITTCMEESININVAADKYDTENATFSNEKGYFVMDVPFRKMVSKEIKEY